MIHISRKIGESLDIVYTRITLQSISKEFVVLDVDGPYLPQINHETNSLLIMDKIEIHIADIQIDAHSHVILGIEAPHDVSVCRPELGEYAPPRIIQHAHGRSVLHLQPIQSRSYKYNQEPIVSPGKKFRLNITAKVMGDQPTQSVANESIIPHTASV